MMEAQVSTNAAHKILNAELPYENRQSLYEAGVVCRHPVVLAYQNNHPLSKLSGMVCDHFAYCPNDKPRHSPSWEPLVRYAYIGGCYRSPQFKHLNPVSHFATVARDVFKGLRPFIYRNILGGPNRCNRCGCYVNIRSDVDHVQPQHSEIVSRAIALFTKEEVDDWFGFRWIYGQNNRLIDHLAQHPKDPLGFIREESLRGTYQVLCKPCHKTVTKDRALAP